MKNRVIISGAAGNLGMAVTKKFLNEKWSVVALAEEGKPDQVKKLENIAKVKPEVLPADLMDPYKSAKLVRKIWAEQPIHSAVLLVGGFSMNSLEKTTSEQLEKMIKLNVLTAYNILQPLFALMKEQGGGNITLIGARPALQPADGEGAVAYALSKGILFHLAEIVNVGTNTHGVAANVVVPSIIDTPENREGMPDSDFSKWVKPEEIADAIYFAAKQSGKGMAGSVLKLYGQV